MFKKNWLALGLAVVLVCVLAIGCVPKAEAPPGEAPAPSILKIGTGPVGGYWFPGGAVLAHIITEYVEGASVCFQKYVQPHRITY